MRILVLLKCAGFLTVALVGPMIVMIPISPILTSPDVRIAVIRLLNLLSMGTIVFFVNKKNHFIIWKPTKKRQFLMPLSIVTGIGMALFSLHVVIIARLFGGGPPSIIIDNKVIFLIGTIVASIMEELFFRGIIFNMWRPYFGSTMAIILSALLFALLHVHPAVLLQTFVLGILLAYFYYYTENIFVPAMMHIFTNITMKCIAFSMVLLPLPLLIILSFTGIIIIFIAKKFFDKILINTKEINNEER